MFKATEDQETEAFVRAAQRKWPTLSQRIIHIANEGAAGSKITAMARAAKMKRQGQIAGCSDFFVATACGGAHGLWLEMKRVGGHLRPEQVEFLERMRGEGYATAVAWGWIPAIRAVEEYLAGLAYVSVPQAFTSCVDGPLSMFTLSGTVRVRKEVRR